MMARTLDLDHAADLEELARILHYAAGEFFDGAFIEDTQKHLWREAALILAEAGDRIKLLQ